MQASSSIAAAVLMIPEKAHMISSMSHSWGRFSSRDLITLVTS